MTENSASCSTSTVKLAGGAMMRGADVATVSVATALVTAPKRLLATTEYFPASAGRAFVSLSSEKMRPGSGCSFSNH